MATRDDKAFERILASLYEAMLDDTLWRHTSALIDEACGITSNAIAVADGRRSDSRTSFLRFYFRGQHREDLEREYLEIYHPIDERVARLRRLADSRLVHVNNLYTGRERKTSPTYNEILPRTQHQDSLNVRLDVSDGAHMTWALGDPVDSGGWQSSRVAMVKRLLPHIRQFVRVRQALVRAAARGTTVAELLENPRIGAIHLDRRGRILEVNDRAHRLLGHGTVLSSDRGGTLFAHEPSDQLRLECLLAAALPAPGAVAISGSMLLDGQPELPTLAVHVKPVSIPQPDYAARHVAALVLIVEPGNWHRIDPAWVAAALGLTPPESQVAVLLAEGKSVREIARIMELSVHTIYWHLQQIYRKKAPLSRQVDLVRLVLSVADLG